MANEVRQRRTTADYRIACICPMSVEVAPVEGMLDEIHDPIQPVRGRNAYTLGSIGGHNIVVATMPEIGNNAAAATVTQLLNDFPAVQFGLLVGIGGGVPGDADVRLGDVVVGQPTGEFPGVVQYDMGKELIGGRFKRTGSLNKPPAVLSANVRKLDSHHRRLGRDLQEHLSDMLQRYPAMRAEYSIPSIAGKDRLFLATYDHVSGPTCDQCDGRYLVNRSPRPDHEPRIHYGTIGSGDRVMKNASQRDKIHADTGALCIEMEAAGLMSDFPCLVIRGICDYADSHKNKEWQPYAAAMAAAYTKALLQIIPAQEVPFTGQADKSTMSIFKVGLHLTEAPIIGDDLYLDRVAELQAMEKILRPQDSVQNHRRLILGGIGGIGKTQLAIAYAKRYHSEYDSVFWLNATSEAVLKQSCRLIAQQILSVERYQSLDDGQVLVHVIRWLSDTRNTRWLLIFDNYDDSSAYGIGKYCPHGLHGSVIITTRYPDQVQGHQLLVRPLEDVNQSLDILATRSKRVHTRSDPQALDLAKRMQGLPLALATVGAYLRHSPWTFREYLQIYEKQFNVDAHRPLYLPEYREQTLYTTWDITYVRLEADHPRAARLLRSFAFFDNQNIQYNLFRVNNDHSVAKKLGKIRSRFRSLLREETENDFWKWLQRMSVDEFTSAMRTLTEYCFVEVRSAHRDYSIHSCIHDWALSTLSTGTQTNGYWFAFDQIVDTIGNIDPDNFAYPTHSAITPHAVRLAHISFDTISYGASRRRLRSMHQIAAFLYAQVALDAAEHMFLRALAGKEKVFGSDHMTTLTTVNHLGILYLNQGRLEKAERMFTRALTGYEKARGPEHIFTFIMFDNLGGLYRCQGKLEKAEQMHKRSLAGKEKALGRDHADNLTTVHQLATIYLHQGKLDEAEQMFIQSLAGYEKAFGPQHTSTLSTVINLGLLYHSQGRLEEAERMYTRTLTGFEEALGPDHIKTLNAAVFLGTVHNDQGKLDRAEQIFIRALAGFRKSLNEDDPRRLRLMINFASLLYTQNKIDEARDAYQQIVTICIDRRVDAVLQCQSIADDYLVALGNCVSMRIGALVEARPHVLGLIEHIRQYGNRNITATRCLAKALLHLGDDESVERVLLCHTPWRHGKTLDLGGAICGTCHHRLSTVVCLNICRRCIQHFLCDQCLSVKRTDPSSSTVQCGHDQFSDFGAPLRQALISSPSRDPTRVETLMDELQQRYQSMVVDLRSHSKTNRGDVDVSVRPRAVLGSE